MENDSLNVEAAQDSAAVEEIQMPSAEQLGITVVAGVHSQDGTLLPMNAVVGDTIDFPVTVSWSVSGSALLVLPTNSATAKGLEQIGVSQESARSVKDGKEIASITFNYKILALDTGNLNIPVLKYDIPTQMGMPLTLRTESVPLRVDAPASVLPVMIGVMVAVVVLLAGMLRMKRRASNRAAMTAKKAAESELLGKMTVLKQRVNSADSRQWLLDLEAICKEYAAERFYLDAEKVNLEVLQKQGNLEGWESLLEEFSHARYGGGKRDGFENRETWKLAMKLMGIREEW